jgi:hypothetical protein
MARAPRLLLVALGGSLGCNATLGLDHPFALGCTDVPFAVVCAPLPGSILVSDSTIYYDIRETDGQALFASPPGPDEPMEVGRWAGRIALAQSDTAVFVAAATEHEVAELSKQLDPMTTQIVAQTSGRPLAIAIDKNLDPYWIDDEGTVGTTAVNHPLASGEAVDMENVGIAVDARSVYWTDNLAGTVREYVKDDPTGRPSTIAAVGADDGLPIAVAAFGGDVFFTTGGKLGSVRRISLGDGSVTLLAQVGPGFLYGLAVDAGGVYFAGVAVGHGGVVARIDADGSNETVIAEGGSPYRIALDASHVYWTDRATGVVAEANR